MKLRILFTLAILAGLAAAPGAQTFRWDAGHGNDDRVRLRDHMREFRSELREIPRRVMRAIRDGRWDERQADSARRIQERVERRVADRLDRRSRHEARDHRHEARDVEHQARDAARDSGDPCADGHNWDSDRYHHCEVREETMPAGPLTVDAGQNGGIRVQGTDRSDIRIVAVVRSNAREEARARQLVSGVQVQTGGGRVSATGPARESNGESWSVSYRIEVPRSNDLDLNANNGGITIDDVTGTIRFDTTNGGVRLTDLAGAVRGQTRNGGVTVALSGNSWQGEGLEVETTNGGVNLAIPEGYNANLETRTVNGGFRTDYPMTLTGELNYRRGISTTLGSGGPSVRVRTTNGGLRINKR